VKDAQDVHLVAVNAIHHQETCSGNYKLSGAFHAAKSAHLRIALQEIDSFQDSVNYLVRLRGTLLRYEVVH